MATKSKETILHNSRLKMIQQDKVDVLTSSRESDSTSVSVSKTEEAILALVSLGYKRIQVQNVVQNLYRENPSINIEEVIRIALQKI